MAGSLVRALELVLARPQGSATAERVERYSCCRFLRGVGIHAKTLSKWERNGVLQRQTEVILKSPTRVFSAEDVEFGRTLIAFIH